MMNDDNDPLDELPDGLKAIVAGIVAEPAPDDLTDSVRLRLDGQFRSNPVETRAKLYWTVAGVTSLAAAVLAAIVFLLPAARNRPPDIDDNHNVVTFPVPQRPSTEGPSLWAYHRAAIDSLDRLDSLLSEHSAVMLTSDHAITAQTDFFSTSQYLEE
jgi:hypothetical protein